MALLTEERGRIAVGPGRPAASRRGPRTPTSSSSARWPSRPGRCGPDLLDASVLVRDCSSGQGSTGCLRVTVGTPRGERPVPGRSGRKPAMTTTTPTPSAPRVRLPPSRRRPRRPPSRWSLAVDGTGTTAGRDRPAVLRPHAVSQLGRHGGFDLTVVARRATSRSTPTTRWRTSASSWARSLAEALGDKAGIRRFGSIALPLDEALVEVALDLSGRPYLAYDIGFPPETNRPRAPAVRPAAGRGVLAGLRHRRRHHAAPPPASPARTPITSWRPRSRGWPGRCGTPCGSKGGACPPPRARVRDGAGRRRPGHRSDRTCRRRDGPSAPAHRPSIAVLDYGIGNLRSAEKALQHLGADARLVADPDAAAGADGVVLPGVGAFGRCAAGPPVTRPGPVRRRRRRARCPLPRDLRGLPAALRGLRGGSQPTPVSALLPGTVRRLPAGVKHPQMQWNPLVPVEGAGSGLLTGVAGTGLGVLRPLLRPRAHRRHRRPPATTADR